MTGKALLFAGSVLPILWGAAHLLPTRSVVRGFGDITADNRRIITMEWIIEGVALIHLGIVAVLATMLGPDSSVSTAVYAATCLCLVVLAAVSLATGFRIRFLPFRLCPVVLTSSAALILLGRLLV